MKIREIEKYIKENNLFLNPTVKRLGKGNNSDVFWVKDGKNQYSLRTGRKGKEIKNKFINHFMVLKFLEQENIDFVPQAVELNKKENILITTYAPGKPITEIGLNKKGLDLFVRQLVRLYGLKFSRYKMFCCKNKIGPVLPETPAASFKKYGLKRFNYLKKICQDKEVIDWIIPRLKENAKYVKNIKWNEKNLIFSHGDLTGANIIKHKNKIYFIDWERAGLSNRNNYSLAYKFIHFDFFFLNWEKKMEKFAL
ncbi:hypothetical protein DRH27_01195, partial [Candidatus Falkowbacteria bacterium]